MEFNKNNVLTKVSLPDSESSKLLCAPVSKKNDSVSPCSSSRGHFKARRRLSEQRCRRDTFFVTPNSIFEIWEHPVARWNCLNKSYWQDKNSFSPTPLLHVQKHANVSKNRPRGVSRLSMKMVVFGPKMVDSGGK